MNSWMSIVSILKLCWFFAEVQAQNELKKQQAKQAAEERRRAAEERKLELQKEREEKREKRKQETEEKKRKKEQEKQEAAMQAAAAREEAKLAAAHEAEAEADSPPPKAKRPRRGSEANKHGDSSDHMRTEGNQMPFENRKFQHSGDDDLQLNHCMVTNEFIFCLASSTMYPPIPPMQTMLSSSQPPMMPLSSSPTSNQTHPAFFYPPRTHLPAPQHMFQNAPPNLPPIAGYPPPRPYTDTNNEQSHQFQNFGGQQQNGRPMSDAEMRMMNEYYQRRLS